MIDISLRELEQLFNPKSFIESPPQMQNPRLATKISNRKLFYTCMVLP
jgi:hypothetical protein